MPEWAKRKITSRGGAIRWRTFKKGGKTFRVAVTKKKGPRGGKTVAYEIPVGEKKKKKKVTKRTTTRRRTTRRKKTNV